jgi:methionyl-tRNA formyltransferase
MRAILVGAVESSQVALRALGHSPDWDVAAVVTLLDDLSGRHSDFTDLSQDADALGIDVIRVRNVNDEDALAKLEALAADYIFVVGWSQICGPDFLALAPERVIGYHPAPLPRMRGRAAIPWTILQQEAITAGTLFWIDSGTDTGAVLDQHFFHVSPRETAASLYAKHMKALSIMFERTLPILAAGHMPRLVQDEECATWSARRGEEDGWIDWSAPAVDVARLVRAVGRPYPGAFTHAKGKRLQIWSADACDRGERHFGRSGQVVEVHDGGFTVLCGERTSLNVTEWNSPDQRPPRLHSILGERP